MKKILMIVMVMGLVVLSGCTKVSGLYKEGTYFAYDEDTMYTAVAYVDDTGTLKSLFFDAAYIKYDNNNKCPTIVNHGKTQCKPTTKQILGNDYGMKAVSTIDKEWYEQVKTFATKVIKEQGIDWLQLKYKDTNGNITSTAPSKDSSKIYTDSVSGVTISVDNLYRLVSDILNQAKK